MPQLANRMSKVQQSPIVAMNNYAKKLAAEGKDIFNLTIGVPGFLPPKHVYDAAHKAVDNDTGAYLANQGSDELISAFQGRMTRAGFSYDKNEFCVAQGAKNALNNLFIALMNDGEEVLYPAPYWSSYYDNIAMYGGVNVAVQCEAENGYKITPEQLEKAITDKTKIFLFNNPSNPTGMVYSEAEITALGDVLKKYPKIWIISDDLYDTLIFDGKKFHHFLDTHPELKERTIIVQSVSKTYGMPGWRVGMVAAPKKVVDTLRVINANTLMNVCGVAQAAAAAAWSGDQSFLEDNRKNFQRKRDMVMDTFNQINGMTCPKPEGAFYAFPRISAFFGKTYKGEIIIDDTHLCRLLLEHEGVACVPGCAFGDPKGMRLSYALEDARLAEGLKRFVRFFNAIS